VNDLWCPGCCLIKDRLGETFLECIHKDCPGHRLQQDQLKYKNDSNGLKTSDCFS